MPATVLEAVQIPVEEDNPSMTKQFLLLFVAIMVLMVAIAYEDGVLAVASDNVRVEYHVAQDGTWLPIPVQYKLSEKKHFWTMP